MHGMATSGSWDVGDPEGLANACEWMRRHLAILADNARWIIPRSGSIVVIDKTNRRMIRVAGLMPETSTKTVVEAIGWTWIDRANGEDVPPPPAAPDFHDDDPDPYRRAPSSDGDLDTFGRPLKPGS